MTRAAVARAAVTRAAVARAAVARAAVMMLVVFGTATPAAATMHHDADADPSNLATTQIAVPTPSDEAVRFHRTGMLWWSLGVALTLALPVVILTTGLARRILTAVRRVSSHWAGAAAGYGLVYFTLDRLVHLPISLQDDFVRRRAFGLSHATLGSWTTEWLMGAAAVVVIGAVAVPVLYGLMRVSGRHWWMAVSAVAVITTTVATFAYPIVIAPLADEFQPVRDPAVEARVSAVAARVGLDGVTVVEVRKLGETTQVNASVTGLGRTTRIVLWDTLTDTLDLDQIAYVTAHEIGHHVLGHRWQQLVAAAIAICSGLFLAQRLFHRAVTRFGPRWHIAEPTDVASLPLLVAVLLGLAVVSVPFGLAFSRFHEREADRFALELTRDNRAAATTWVTLQGRNLTHPSPGWIYTWFRASHPALAERVRFANRYRPWATGRPLRYQRHLRDPSARSLDPPHRGERVAGGRARANPVPPAG